ncbi:glutaredoxin family protein [Azoarcus sp. L1K30]|uniref:glutaredoxin family protein n=1 Tax=Azoarcus sp. L1K30 TaxID=2820277 RepID=UPI001B841C57|nr:glutaredoxin family protein [Azoarcus sp. L1K30]MBR0566399.1 glutaredoxin family protein [Azoarcus sp. L1K30]
MTRTRFLAVLIALGLSALAQAQTTYRWVDRQGQVHYSDQPPPPEAGTPEARRFAAPPPDPTLSYTLRKLGEDFPVTLYTSANCTDLCASARALLGARGIPFTERILASQDDIADFRDRFGSPEQVPTLSVGRKPFKGFEPGGWNRLLDQVGYPKAP